jgi:hypothetical protein
VKLSADPVNANVQVTVVVPVHEGAAPAGVVPINASGLNPRAAAIPKTKPARLRNRPTTMVPPDRFKLGAA